MHSAVFLHITTVFNDNGAPVAAECCTGPDVHIAANSYIAGNGGLGMHKGGRVNNGPDAVELVKGHGWKLGVLGKPIRS